ncbi:hypothetical protein C8E01_11531 [Pontibacter virosus]|uniref:Uncharacterized protein n=1 Tax=Pontibacter virosus TaxID=1765052 RepID=A0A2U1AQK8_9BACT|nr:hypothetical protein C8E01_11531 [Pontibacter virosus]
MKLFKLSYKKYTIKNLKRLLYLVNFSEWHRIDGRSLFILIINKFRRENDPFYFILFFYCWNQTKGRN